jgi:hypothetical protein
MYGRALPGLGRSRGERSIAEMPRGGMRAKAPSPAPGEGAGWINAP